VQAPRDDLDRISNSVQAFRLGILPDEKLKRLPVLELRDMMRMLTLDEKNRLSQIVSEVA
jgi:hypothetical protein